VALIGAADSPNNSLTIEYAFDGPPGAKRSFTVTGFDDLLSLRIFSPSRLVIIGRRKGPIDRVAAEAAIVRLPDGQVLDRFPLRSPVALPDTAQLLYRDLSEPARFYAYDVARLTRTIISIREKSLLMMRWGTLVEKQIALQLIEREPSWWEGEDLRRAVEAELLRALNDDIAAAGQRSGGSPLPVKSDAPRRSYYERLVRLAGRWRDRRFLTVLVRADTWSTATGVINLGTEAVPAILQAWNRADPSGYSPYYRARLLLALQQIATAAPALYRMPELVEVVSQVLQKPPSWRCLMIAIDLADDMDDETLMERVRQLASDAELLRRLVGDDEEGLTEVRTRAQYVIGRRWTLPY